MYIWNKESLKSALNDELVYINENIDFNITNVVFDSTRSGKNSLFVAKKGERTDGHKFIKNALENGAFVLAEYVLEEELNNNPKIIIVKNTVQAMEKMAVYRRDELKGKVIGITGSLGKTTTKDLVFSTLNLFGKTSCNIQSFNNYIGVLTTIINTPADTEYAIFEIGMNNPGELRPLAKLVRPDISIITNIEPAHLGCFNNIDEIAFEKSEILPETKELAILNLDNKYYKFLEEKAINNNLKVFNFGKNKDANVVLEDYSINSEYIDVKYNVFGEKFNANFNNLDINVVFNSLAVIAVVKYLNLDVKMAINGLSKQECSRGRNNLEKVKYINNKDQILNLNIINGTYNAVNPKAFNSGFELMKNFKNFNNKICIFGPIKEAGEKTDEFHLSLKDKIIDCGANIVVLFSEEMKILYDALKETNIKLYYFDNYEKIIENIDNIVNDNDLIFIKSSKSSKTYKIFNYLNKNNPMDLFV